MDEWTKETRQRASGRNAFFSLTHPLTVPRNRFVVVVVIVLVLSAVVIDVADDLRLSPLLDIIFFSIWKFKSLDYINF